MQEESLEDFLKWAVELGISDSTTTVRSQSPVSSLGHSMGVSHFLNAGGRGLCAVRDLRKGELILKVPKSALMTRDSVVMKDPRIFLAANSRPSLSPTQLLSIYLLYEVGKGKDSKWHRYLIHLPRTYDILATFGKFEMQALQVDEARWTVEKAVLKAQSDWNEARGLMEDLKLKPQLLTFRAWLWATATISSRTLHIPWDEAGCLCPVGDLFNYVAPGKDTSSREDVEQRTQIIDDMEECDSNFQRLTDGGFEEGLDAYCFYARESYKKGEQVLICYGTYTNLELLEHYGFLLNENPNDKVFIHLEAAIYSSSSWPKESLFIHSNGKPSFALLSSLRLWATPQNKRRYVGHLAYSGSQLSVNNEIYVMQWLSERCHAVLKSLPTSIEEDRSILRAIDDSLDTCSSLLEVKKEFSWMNEVFAFLEADNLGHAERDAGLFLSKKTTSSMNRWKLAVDWRLKYKEVLHDCISYCSDIIKSLSS